MNNKFNWKRLLAEIIAVALAALGGWLGGGGGV